MHTDLLGLILLLGAGLLVFLAALILYTRHLLTHPPRRTYAWAVSRNLPGDPSELPPLHSAVPSAAPHHFTYTEWTFRSRGHDLPVWDIPGLAQHGPLIVMIHGWGDSRITMLPRIAALAPLASRILVFDLPGHGTSPRNSTSTLGVHEVDDLLALLTTLTTAPSSAPTAPRTILYGFSLGAGIAIAAATRSSLPPIPLAAVIAEAPYRLPITPARNVLRARGLPYRLNLPAALQLIRPRTEFDRADDARHLAPPASPTLPSSPSSHIPLLVLHGEHDDISPIADGRAIAEAAHGHFTLIPNSGHNTIWNHPHSAAQATEAIGKFFERTMGRNQLS